MSHSFVRVNGLRLHVASIGPKDGELVVLLHGFPEFWQAMEPLMQALAARGYRVLAPDQRGYNLSDKPSRVNDYALDVLASDVTDVIASQGHSQAHVIGHDWGGAVAWWLAMRSPDAVISLGIVNAPHPIAMAGYIRRHAKQMAKSWYMGAFQVPKLPELAFSAAARPRLASRIAKTARPGAMSPAYLQSLQSAWARPGAATGMLNWYRAMFRAKNESLSDVRVHVPTLILWGEKDAFLDVKLAHACAELCDDARVMVRPQATHWVLHDEPEHSAEVLGEWLDERSSVPR